MQIDERDILQVNATIIAGILIFLTISLVTEPITFSDPPFKFIFKVIVRYVIMVTLVPFVLSIFVILRDEEPTAGSRFDVAKRISRFGTLLLLFAVIVVLIPFTFD